MAINIKKDRKKQVNLNYLNKDFEGFQRDIREFARAHYSDKIQDFSESGLGGMFVDMTAYVGDVLSYYLDHQFNELDIRTAIEEDNIERIARNTGIKLRGASPAITEIEFYCRVPSKIVNEVYVPDSLYLPKILEGTKLATSSGLIFELAETLDFNKKDTAGNLLTEYAIGETTPTGIPINFICLRKGICVSASTFTETFDVSREIIPFRTFTLAQSNVNEIVSVVDSDLNEYYEVDNLAQDTVFETVDNMQMESNTNSQSALRVIAAPRRFVSEYSRATGLTTLTFGAGVSDTYEDDVIPNPSDHSIRLFGDRKVFGKINIDPNDLLSTNTLGTAPVNTTLTVKYRAGGGSTFNVNPGTINQIDTLLAEFDSSGTASVIRSVRNSVEVDNAIAATGGTDRLSTEGLRSVAIAGVSAQGRVVSKKDLIARIYTMPGNLGRFYRVGVRSDPKNPNASVVSAICINNVNKLTYPTDLLKKNLAIYLDEFRIIGDAIEILDAPVVNLGINFKISVLKTHSKQNTVSNVIQRLKRFLRTQNMNIDQPLNISEIETIIQLSDGVNSVVELEIYNITGNVNNLDYIGENFGIIENISNKILYPPAGGIFEVRYPNKDIKGSAM